MEVQSEKINEDKNHFARELKRTQRKTNYRNYRPSISLNQLISHNAPTNIQPEKVGGGGC